uniref:Uncharacterized protein LOC101505731 n=1 Tax=Cicer arietinum TaxID=3827 RepID=A0A3Q7YGI3_CICAR|nr:uncharacterized protein LOC101505731 [Cicer arietinum]
MACCASMSPSHEKGMKILKADLELQLGVQSTCGNLYFCFQTQFLYSFHEFLAFGSFIILVVQEFVLGVYDPEATAAINQNLSDISTLNDPRSKDASQRYHAHQYTNGTTCDLTDKSRETEVRFVCSEPRAMISSITDFNLQVCTYSSSPYTMQASIVSRGETDMAYNRL